MKNFALLLCTFLFCAPVYGQEPLHPAKLVGFLRPGMAVEVVENRDKDLLNIGILTEQDFLIVSDAQTLTLDELGAKHETVAKSIAEAREAILRSMEETRKTLPPDVTLGEPVIQFGNRIASIYKIEALGEDYVLVVSAKHPQVRRVFATQYIKSIDWQKGWYLNWNIERGSEPTGLTSDGEKRLEEWRKRRALARPDSTKADN